MFKGLSNKEAEKILKEKGYNEFDTKQKRSALNIFFSQFKSPLIILLLLSALISLFINNTSYIDSLLIFIIVVISAFSSFFQEYKAEKSLRELSKYIKHYTIVIRSSKKIMLENKYLVEGDIIFLKDGSLVPADAVILKGSLEIDESMLTGESRSVFKKVKNKIYAGTFVNKGEAYAKIYSTGKNTKIAKIAKSLKEIEKPKNMEIAKISRKIFYFALFIISFIFVFASFKYSISFSLLLAVSLAVAAIPEALPAVITLALSLSAKRMAKKKMLVRRLSKISDFAFIDYLCVDKTGTLTHNDLQIDSFYENFSFKNDSDFLLKAAYLSSDAYVLNNKLYGDQIDKAIYKAVKEKQMAFRYEVIDKKAFDSERKLASKLVKEGNSYFVYTKGALEKVLERSSHILLNNKMQVLDNKTKERIIKDALKKEKDAKRLIAVAYKKSKILEEESLIFLGIISFWDPVRKDVKKALKEAKRLKIKVVMITGDSLATAEAVAKSLSFDYKEAVFSKEINYLNDDELFEKIENGCRIFARADPFHKLKILSALQRHYKKTAMTGDGVNDVLAIKKADIGIAMGKKGSTVAKESADFILLDDNFSNIISSIFESKRVFYNMRRFLNFLFSSNLAELLFIFFTSLFLSFKNALLLPIHILWINLLTDGFPALALANDCLAEKKKYAKEKELLNKRTLFSILENAFLILIALFFVSLFFYGKGFLKLRTAVFTSFVLFEFARVYSLRKKDSLDFYSNKLLLLSLIVSFALQLFIIFFANSFFHITSLNIYEFLIIFAFSFIIFLPLFFKK